jgi:hypothetical protein
LRTDPTSGDARRLVNRLIAQRSTARGAGIAPQSRYMQQLEADLEAAREAYTGLAVTEMATRRGDLVGRQVG